ncbi:hypothetical protein DR950_26980 [Kitasatospora xanthocidica]|uniref:Uncharacterized protein n=1 Tax=Kitasatospora xanthocidica TaxID=83382 RepID=A0A372ZYC7_9ACTN|nr:MULTISPECIES: hypothetical protein [Streptomycetaceae]OKI00042.1 hypothetical protein AMK13_33685 [Streptomyces sp. CB02056]RGD60928.1 hypothetical protein DR950_26980 [Kitasatospora xanthocidica]
MARRGGDLEAFIAFLGGLAAAGLAALAMAGVGLTVRPTPALRTAALVTLGAVWLTATTAVYRRLRARTDRPTGARRGAQPSKSRAAESS